MTEKVTLMVLNTVDLECSSCYNKVKKVLCKFPQIIDQIYDEKNNKVQIKVVCCSPEKIRDKLCCIGGKVIKSIEILEAPELQLKDPELKAPEKHKEPEKPPAPVTVLVPVPVLVPAPATTPAPPPPPKAPKVVVNMCVPVQGYPGYRPIPMYPSGACCGPCSDGVGGGPCYHGYGRPVPPPPAPCYDGYRYGYGYRGSKCCVNTDYFSEENPQGCTIM
ncbi:protein PYRICULARIA ORYZAE RESISTANCE 21-like [Heracleum sosnowskyi]|uniref:Protein PYRICULARIA ORYZAE RESISTANCE 21-like n=1 Tax=Heracleum sosnowskyi TaxID=360622 RepID=A0AAD8J0I3_9APIA|nr:protein PYRICULARIA ORYZAE RESISTANCE 21-like [Heracleum sosnowskyi]